MPLPDRKRYPELPPPLIFSFSGFKELVGKIEINHRCVNSESDDERRKPHRKKNSTMCRKYRPASIEGFPVTCSYLLSLHSFKLKIMLIDFGTQGAHIAY